MHDRFERWVPGSRPGAIASAGSAARGAFASLAVAALATALLAGPAFACSPPIEEPTVTALPDGAVVIVGTTGEPVEGGRLFYVERVFAGDIAASPIVIAFKEGEPIGDCSYPMTSGVHLLIAPVVYEDGTLGADLSTLQADPLTDVGQRYLGQAQARYGDGVVPPGPKEPVGLDLRLPTALALTLLAAAIVVIAWTRTGTRSAKPPDKRDTP